MQDIAGGQFLQAPARTAEDLGKVRQPALLKGGGAGVDQDAGDAVLAQLAGDGQSVGERIAVAVQRHCGLPVGDQDQHGVQFRIPAARPAQGVAGQAQGVGQRGGAADRQLAEPIAHPPDAAGRRHGQCGGTVAEGDQGNLVAMQVGAPGESDGGAQRRGHARFRTVPHGVRDIDGKQHQPARPLSETLVVPVRRGGTQRQCGGAVSQISAHGGGKSGGEVDCLERFVDAVGGAAGALPTVGWRDAPGAMSGKAAPAPQGRWCSGQVFAAGGSEDAFKTFFLR